jgi:dCMP deaminase
LCICVHAEQNALLAAARFGIAVEEGVVYTTLQPCFGCMKEMLQAKISRVYYLHPWQPRDSETKVEYEKLAMKFKHGIKRVDMQDPDVKWAVSAMRDAPQASIDEHGHEPL